MDAVRLRPLVAAVGSALAAFAANAEAAGGIRTDGTVGPAQTLTGPNFVVPQTLGKVSGNNLFHSFQAFGIDYGQSANFQTNVSGNVISRVTGGMASEINGGLRMTATGGATPAFWFINPAGVVFGQGASLSVPGAFHVATADYVRFADGTFFHADPSRTSSFSTASPEAFGFTGASRATLAIRNVEGLYNYYDKMTFTGGDVTITSSRLENTTGDIRIVAIGQQAAEVKVDGSLQKNAQGALRIADSDVLTNVSGRTYGGYVALAGGDVVLDNAWVRTTTTGRADGGTVVVNANNLTVTNGSRLGSEAKEQSSGQAGYVEVVANGDVTISEGSRIVSNTYGSGNAGDVYLSASSLNVDGGRSYSYLSSDTLGSGNGGTLEVQVSGLTRVFNGGWISSDTYASGYGGTVYLRTGSLAIDGKGYGTGISSETLTAATGEGGWVDVAVKDWASIINGGRVSTRTFGSGNAGYVSFLAGSLKIDGTESGIVSDARSGSRGNAGYVEVAISGDAMLTNSARISSSTDSVGNAGYVDFSSHHLQLESKATIASSTSSSGNAGSVTVRSHSLTIDGKNGEAETTGIFSNATGANSGDAGAIDVTVVEAMRLIGRGGISSNSYGKGNGGDISISAGSLELNNAAITSRLYGGGKYAGWIFFDIANQLSMSNFSEISSSTWSAGDAGYVRVRAGSVDLNGSGLYSSAVKGSTGEAGWVEIDAAGSVRLTNYSEITTNTYTPKSAGRVAIVARALELDEGSSINSSALLGSRGNAGQIELDIAGPVSLKNGSVIYTNTFGAGNAGDIALRAESLTITGNDSDTATGISSASDYRASGSAGNIGLGIKGDLLMSNLATVSSNAFGQGNGGNLYIEAANLTLNNAALLSNIYADRGYGGYIQLNIANGLRLGNNARISTSTYGGANAGFIEIASGTAEVSKSEISSDAAAGSWGWAGWISVKTAGELRVANGGRLTTDTSGWNDAGYISVDAGSVILEGQNTLIAARARAGSGGQTGGIAVVSREDIAISDGASITIANDARVQRPDRIFSSDIYLEAKNLSIHGGSVSANSTGNIAASNIGILFSDRMRLQGAELSTSSAEGNGGAILVKGDNALFLDRSRITTSVSSLTNGNGGGISLDTRYLAMNSGFIQANTAATKAQGGNIGVHVTAVVPSNNSLIVGGTSALDFDPARQGYNVIQAAAPDGVSGNIQITSPVLDLSASLAGLQAQVLQNAGLGRSPCDTGAGSSLAVVGRGGLPPTAREALRVEVEPRVLRATGDKSASASRGCKDQEKSTP